MNYYSYDITTPQYNEEKGEVLTAVLGDLPFDTFEDTGSSLKVYIPEEDLTAEVEKEFSELAQQFDFQYVKTFIPYQNWNMLWESNFNPIQVDDFVAVRADFHPPTEGVEFDLVINPKMAFGTGHHETTYMMMQLMREMQFEGKKVLDYGCGTGILAILASKLKATYIEAVDIELPSFDNTIENCEINDVANVKPFHGTLDVIKASDFDIILANINRNVILDSLKSLKSKIKQPKSVETGVLLISGFLKEDETIMSEAVIANGFTILKTIQKGNWLCMLIGC
jgi:ribosomal protein L11 methyltransferase